MSFSAGGRRSAVLTFLERRRGVARLVFLTYALVLFVGTHWPALDIRVEGIERPDLFVHFGVFGIWIVLLWTTGLVGSIDRWSTLPVLALVGCGYSAIDERLQAIPWMRRTCAWDDLQANWIGIGLGVVLISVLMLATGAGRAGQSSGGRH